MKNKKYIVIIVIVVLVMGVTTCLYFTNREYKYICFNMDVTSDTLIVESYLEECTTNKILPKGVITDKSELLTEDTFTSYRQIKDIYTEGEMLYSDDFILYEAPRATETDIELLTEVEVATDALIEDGLPVGTLDELVKYKIYIKNNKLYAINLNTNEERIIFDKEEVKNIAVRPICCTGNGQLLILTTSGNVYISEHDCNYFFSFDFPFNKLEGSDIVSFKLIPVDDNDFTKNLYGVNPDGEEVLLQKLN